MEPLVTNRRCLVWLCICPADEYTSRWQKLAYIIFAMFVSSGLIGGSAACLAFSWKFLSIDLGRAMFAFTFVAAEFTAIYMALVGVISMRRKIDTIFKNLSTIYKNSKCFLLEYKIELWLKISPEFIPFSSNVDL